MSSLCRQLIISYNVIMIQSNNFFIKLNKQMMHSYKANIIGHQTQSNGKIAYEVEVKDESTNKTKISKLRYSQFRDIHEQLQQLVNKLKLHITLPEFPGRKLFGSTNKSQDAIFQRQKGLVSYLNDLLEIEKLTTLEVMRKYYIPDQHQSPIITHHQQQLNMQICIDRYTLVDDAVIYYVRLRDLNSHQEWVYKARYSQLRSLHQALVEAKVKNLPNFPKKKLFGMTNQNPDDIEKRREELQKYFNQVFNVKQVLNSEPIRYFIQQSKKEAQKEKDFQAMRKKNSG